MDSWYLCSFLFAWANSTIGIMMGDHREPNLIKENETHVSCKWGIKFVVSLSEYILFSSFYLDDYKILF